MYVFPYVHGSLFVQFAVDDGSMKPQDRDAALAKIKKSVNVKVILISFKAGSTGSSFITDLFEVFTDPNPRSQPDGVQQCDIG